MSKSLLLKTGHVYREGRPLAFHPDAETVDASIPFPGPLQLLARKADLQDVELAHIPPLLGPITATLSPIF